jgi:DNA-binding response OmpR family regulator
MTLLLIEDDPDIQASLSLALSFEGYSVSCAANGSDGLRLLRAGGVDAVILDVLLPGSDGYRVLDEIRALPPPAGVVPVVMVTALDEVEDKVRGLRRGADDYLVKPFALAELTARLEAVLRRRGPPDSAAPLLCGDLTLYPERLGAERGGRALALSPKEFLLLNVLVEHEGRIVSKEALIASVWREPIDLNTLEVHISNLRRALGPPPLIRTVRGYGYLLQLGS